MKLATLTDGTLDGQFAITPFMKFGDRVRIEMLDPQGASLFGAIDQRVVQAVAP